MRQYLAESASTFFGVMYFRGWVGYTLTIYIATTIGSATTTI